MLSTSSIPACLHMAENTSSEPAREPVCEFAATVPAGVRPPLIMTIGLCGVILRAVSMSFLPSLAPSIYDRMTSVSGSVMKYSK